MADETFKIALAIGTQTAAGGFGFVNSTIAALSGSVDSTDGFVLGNRESGDAESGIAIPSFDAITRPVQDVASSFTKQYDAFIRTAVNGFSVSFPLQGNGATATTPAAGEAALSTLLPGIDSIFQCAGLIAANSTAPIVNYTPRHAASTSGSTIYGTAKLWIGDLSWVLQDCLVESMEMVFTPGGNGIATANFKVGSVNAFADGVTFPTIDYTSQASLAAPVVEGVAFAWGQTRGFESLTVTIENPTEEFGDSNVSTTGTRQSQTGRIFRVDGTLYVNASDSDYEYANLIGTSAPTDDMSFQVGTAAGASDTINAYYLAINNVQAGSIKPNKRGTALVQEISGNATATTAGAEFVYRLN